MIDFSKIELVIFDLDGTLIDSALDLAAALERALAEEGIMRYSLDDLLKRIGVGSKNLLKELVNDDPIVERRVFDYYIKHYSTTMFATTKLFPQVQELLERLDGKIVALLSNKREEPCKKILQYFKIDHHFKATLGGDSLPHRKPSPEPILHICKLLNIQPENTVMIGDSPVDIESGSKAGTQTIGILKGLTPEEIMRKYPATLFVDQVGDLLPIIDSIAHHETLKS